MFVAIQAMMHNYNEYALFINRKLKYRDLKIIPSHKSGDKFEKVCF